MNFKPLLLCLGASLLIGACASADKQNEKREVPVKRDPAIAAQTQRNEKLARQTAAQMGKSLKVPSITYKFDSIRPPEEAYPILDKIVTVMKDNPSLHLICEGHTDIVGDKEYNYWLGGSRAAAMKSYIVSRGINAERIRTQSHGADRPITLDTSSEGRQANRRVEFTFTKRKWLSIY